MEEAVGLPPGKMMTAVKKEAGMAAADEAEDRLRARRCELCPSGEAAVHCEPDEARLCWACDARVHAANFLVARHPRTLLCRCCRCPTPWRAVGPRLSPILSLCLSCCRAAQRPPPKPQRGARGEFSAGEIEAEGGEENADDGDVEREDDEKEEGYGENQVVPWSTSSSAMSPAVCTSSSSSSSSDVSSYDKVPISSIRSLKRIREKESSQADRPTSSSEPNRLTTEPEPPPSERNPCRDDDASSFEWCIRKPKRAAIKIFQQASPDRLAGEGGDADCQGGES